MKVTTSQFSFAGGELSPRLRARADLQKYASGAALIENFLIRPEGGLMRRPGTRFAGETRDAGTKTRLIPFIFSTVQAYMLEFGDNVIRVWKDGAPVANLTRSIMGISQGNPARVTSFGHGFANGDRVLVTGVRGMLEVNNREFTVANADADGFELSGFDASSLRPWSGAGYVSRLHEIASPYAASELDDIVHAQSADVLYLVHPAHAPRTLTRTGHAAWTLSPVPLDRGPFAAMNGDDTLRVMCTAASGFQPGAQLTLKASGPIFTSAHAGSWFRMQEIYLSDNAVSPWSPGEGTATTLGTQVSSNGNVYALSDIGAGTQTGTVPPSHTEGDAWDNPIGAANRKKWRYLHARWAIVRLDSFVDSRTMQATAVTYLCNGLVPATRAITAVTNAAGLCRISAPGHGYDEGDYVSISGVAGATQANGDWKIINVTPAGFDLANSSPPSSFLSGGTVRRYATWLWMHSAFSRARGYPATVALHEQRLAFANTTAQPFGLWMSASADYANFLPGTKDDETIAYNIAASQADPVRWLASSSDLLLGTLSQEFAAFGGGLGDPITPSNTRIVPQSGEGANGVQPVRIGTETVFVNRTGRRVISLGSEADTGAYTATDLNELAGHLTLGAPITRLAWARNPASLLWALRADGALLSLTYRREQQVYGWARHDLGGTVESIAVIPSTAGAHDELWLVVRRSVAGRLSRFIEILSPPFEPTGPHDKAAMCFLDASLRYEGTPVTSVSGLAHLDGEEVQVTVDGALHPSRIVTAGSIGLETAGSSICVGLGYASTLRSLSLDLTPQGFVQDRARRILRTTIRVLNALGGEAGTDEGMQELVRRDQGDRMDASPPLFTGDIDILPPSTHGTAPQLTIRQRDPLPLDILSVTAVLQVGEA